MKKLNQQGDAQKGKRQKEKQECWIKLYGLYNL